MAWRVHHRVDVPDLTDADVETMKASIKANLDASGDHALFDRYVGDVRDALVGATGPQDIDIADTGVFVRPFVAEGETGADEEVDDTDA